MEATNGQSNHSKKSWIDHALSFDGSKESWDSDLDGGIEELTEDQQYMLPPELVETSNSSTSYSDFNGVENEFDSEDLDDEENEKEQEKVVDKKEKKKQLQKHLKEMKREKKKKMTEIAARQWFDTYQDYFTKTKHTTTTTPPMTIRKTIKAETTAVAAKDGFKNNNRSSYTETSTKEADVMKQLVRLPGVSSGSNASTTTTMGVHDEFTKINDRIRAARMRVKATTTQKQPRSNSMTIVDQVVRQEKIVESRRTTWLHKLGDTRQRKSEILGATSTHSEPSSDTKRTKSWIDDIPTKELEKLLLITSTHSVPDTVKRDNPSASNISNPKKKGTTSKNTIARVGKEINKQKKSIIACKE